MFTENVLLDLISIDIKYEAISSDITIYSYFRKFRP